MVWNAFGVAERLMRYVQIDTQSDPNSLSFPSTEKQKDLSTLLLQELLAIGLVDATMDTNGYVMATIPATIEQEKLDALKLPVICFCAHVDTAPDCSGTDVKPILHQQYNGAPIVLPDDPTQIITVEKYPYLKNFIGKEIITASGKTLLGSDDKAGVAIIVSLAAYLMQHPSIQHGPIKILFTPDEEVGRGADFIDFKKLNADFGYTLDGGALGCFEMESFSADHLVLTIDGVMAHPGSAKGVMQNAIKIASDIIAALPRDQWCPEHTEGKAGFVHPTNIQGGAEQVQIEFLIRDFDTANLAIYEQRILDIAEGVIRQNPYYNESKVKIEVKQQYRNMKEVIDQYPQMVDLALDAYKRAGIQPVIEPIRGGTDGSRMSFMGLPTANIFTGMQAIHSKHEWVGVADMQQAVQVLAYMVEIN
ncbi:MAG: peptidase T [Chitinophagaceae bacterium]|jgi:tripeptide aminopeptidase|nr:peptidase T [Chitinophagaceae bacterium]MCF8422574.1 peptidase T [Chitinophagaceae bacterium]